jgi:hypothetical protein
MDKLLRDRRYDDACRTYYRRKFRRRFKIALARIARLGGCA